MYNIPHTHPVLDEKHTAMDSQILGGTFRSRAANLNVKNAN